MIGKLTGVVEQIEEGRCLIDVNGVGYVVFMSQRSLAALPQGGLAALPQGSLAALPQESLAALPRGRASVLIETQVREDAITLYGFIDSAERDWFRLLTTVQGVGAKVALAILSALPPDKLAGAIVSADRAAITRAPGVGPKLAARLIAELRERVAAMPTGAAFAPIVAVGTPAAPSVIGDAISALINLGYRRGEAEAAVAASLVALGADAALDGLIRDGLRRLAR